MEIIPELLTGLQRYKLLTGSVVPRPIALVSTISALGHPNLAPFSFYNVVCFNPMILAFFPLRFKTGTELKDTVKNIKETGEFVINATTADIAWNVNQASGIYPADADEFIISGLTPVPSTVVHPARVKESPIHFECRLHKMISFGDEEGGSDAVFGKVVHVHIADHLIQDYKIDFKELKPVARLAGLQWSMPGEIFELERPKIPDADT